MRLKAIVSVSVIIPCFNSEETIKRALESIKNQTVQVLEIICVDDKSSDLTLESIEIFRLENPELSTHVIKNKVNGGPGNSRNRGWEIATGDYIAFLDADDAWDENKIFIQYSWMTAHPNVVMSGHSHSIYGKDRQSTIDIETEPNTENISRLSILTKNPFVTPSVMLKRELGYRFKNDKRYCEDHLLWSEIVLNGNKVVNIKTPLVIIFKELLGSSGLSENIWNMEIGELEMYDVLVKNRLINIPFFYSLIVFSLLKYLKRWLSINTTKYITRIARCYLVVKT
jgi:glycosyltransferase involved in cell wall biosynthesis